MEALGLLNDAYNPNAYKIRKTGIVGKEFPKELPGVLRGIMEEREYVNYVTRIEREEQTSSSKTKPIFFVIIFFFVVIFVLSFLLGSDSGAGMGVAIGVFCVIFVLILIASCMQRSNKFKMAATIETITTEINQRYFARGIRWTYVPATGDNQSYIEVMFFNPNSLQSGLSNPSAPTSYSSISSTSNTDSFNIVSPSYMPSAPPPATTTTTTQSYSSDHYTSITVTPEEPSAPFVPSYPGDPTMFTVVD